MKRTTKFTAFAALLIFAFVIGASAQKKAPDYKITAIHVTPFNGVTGEFDTKLGPDNERSFFNDLSTSLLVSVEVAGETGSFEAGRMVEVTVMEGKKLKKKKTEQIGVLHEGKFFTPVWLDSSMCSEITITARLIGQKTVSKKTMKIPFMCGE